jgi:hypothetical protein
MQMRGRKHKFSSKDRFRVKESAPADFRERLGSVVAQGPGKAEYTVILDDDPNNVTYLQSHWMETIVETEPCPLEVSIRK